MSTANIYDHTGKKTKTTTLPSSVFAASVKPEVLNQALHVYRTNQSQHSSRVKSRGEVTATKAKAYRQKGTGNARHGAKSAPIFVGGGVAHGPKAAKPARKKLNTKMRRLSLMAAFTNLAKDKSVSIIANPGKITSKTKDLDKLLTKLKLDNEKTLLLTNETYPKLNQAAKNIDNLTLKRHQLTNVYQLLNTKHLIIDQGSLKSIVTWLTGKKQPSKEKKPASSPKTSKTKK